MQGRKEGKFFKKWSGMNRKGRKEREREIERFLERREEDPSLKKQNFLKNRKEREREGEREKDF